MLKQGIQIDKTEKKASEEKNIKVTVWCNTFNHADCIEDALNGFLIQKTDFEFQVIIYDDGSTDGTSESIKKGIDRFDNIVIFSSKSNLYGSETFRRIQDELIEEYAVGEYIALCEGDDYWIDRGKLQSQVEYLDSHPKCILCMHNGVEYNCDTGKISQMNPYLETGTLSPRDCIVQSGIKIPTASYMVRSKFYKVPDTLRGFGVGDYPLQLYCLSKGDVYYYNKVMSVYRRAHIGSWSGRQKETKTRLIHLYNMLNLMDAYDEYTKRRWHEFVSNKNQLYCEMIISVYRQLGVSNDEDMDLEVINPIASSKFDRIMEIYNLRTDGIYIPDRLKEYFRAHKKVYIMGMGNFAKALCSRINMEIVAGFFSSFEPTLDHFMEKEVLPIESLNRDHGVVIAINPVNWDEIIKTLKKYGIEDYICPYLIEG